MTNCRNIPLKILAVEPIGAHESFDRFFLRCFRTLGHVTLAAPVRFAESADVDARIDIPAPLFRQRGKVGARWNAIRVLDYILKNVSLEDYDVIVFLAYETISFSVRWPRSKKVFLFEHNNIENARGSYIKTFFYNRISANAVRLAFQNPSVQFIQETTGGVAVQVPFPYCRQEVSDSGVGPNKSVPDRPPGQPIVIFSPSSSTPEESQDGLKEFASTRNDVYYAICKGSPAKKADGWETRPFFDDYEGLMQSCAMVFVGVRSRFDYRVSGAAYEALSFGKPVVLFDSVFARELRDENPGLVFVIKDMDDIQNIEIDPKGTRKAQERFLRRHSFDAILTKMATAILAEI